MNKKFFVTSVFAALLVMSPFAASALSISDLQAQVQSLLARISAMQTANPSTSAEVGAQRYGVDAYTLGTPRVCGLLNRNLVRGAQGDDVRGLQEFLTQEGVLSASATGYFGPATADALARWQAREGVQSVGSVGPLTRDLIKRRCGNQYGFRVTPQAGNAPLTVTAYANVGGFSMYRYFIDFGDGSARESIWCSAPADACEAPGTVAHTYTQDGAYTVSLVRVDSQTNVSVVLASESIRVGSNGTTPPPNCSKEYRPVCGAKNVVCIQAPCNPIATTYSNRCMMDVDGASYLYDGACTSTFNSVPVISRFSGPVTLGMNEVGTWNISASDRENGRLSYSIIWGDEWVRGAGNLSTTADMSIVQQTSFTHAYAQPGNYTIRLKVSDEQGNSAESTASVQVSQSVCTTQYEPVCGRPTGCANTCPPGMYCTMMCRLHDPVTYGNRCEMNNANAGFIHTGACTGAENL